MLDFTTHELARATDHQRDREARAIARSSAARNTPRTVRAAIAARLLCLASIIDREVVRSLARREMGAIGRS